MMMHQKLGSFFAVMHGTTWLYPFYKFFKVTGLHRLGHVAFDKYFEAHPTEDMVMQKKFFDEHKKEIQKAYNLLGDERSKKTYENILLFRTTRNREYLRDIITGNQYFPEDIIKLNDSEEFVDCGAFTGDTVKDFADNASGGYGKIVAFEPDIANFTKLSARKYKNLVPLNFGAWSTNTTLSFSSNGTADSLITDEGTTKVNVMAIDSCQECWGATFIKMDIEGAELEALKGAEQTIKKQKPKLAICIYHKPEDFFEIPLYIKNINPNYTLYIRHHFYTYGETVLYAIDETSEEI